MDRKRVVSEIRKRGGMVSPDSTRTEVIAYFQHYNKAAGLYDVAVSAGLKASWRDREVRITLP